MFGEKAPKSALKDSLSAYKISLTCYFVRFLKLPEIRQKMRAAVTALLDDWEHISIDKQGKLQYQKEEGNAPPLLYDPLDPELAKQSFRAKKFKAQRSLRDVEKSVDLWIQRPDGQDFGDES